MNKKAYRNRNGLMLLGLILALSGCPSPGGGGGGAATVDDVTVSPADIEVRRSETQQFTASVTGANNPPQSVLWTVEGGGAGTSISEEGLLTVAIDEAANSLTVRAVSTMDSEKSGTAAVTVLDPPVPTVSEVTVTPRHVTVSRGGMETFTAVVIGENDPAQTVIWSVTGGAAETSISEQGVLTVAINETASYLLIMATSVVDTGKSDIVRVNVNSTLAAVTEVTVTPATASVGKGGTATFTASVTGTGNPAPFVTWSVTGGVAGTSISNAGVLTVAVNESAGSLTVKATSAIDTTKFGTATATVDASITVTVTGVTVSPATASAAKGGTAAFTASVTGTGNPAQIVTWSVTGGTTGTSISGDGILTVAANETAATLTVKATSAIDAAKSGTSAVTVAPSQLTGLVSVTGTVRAGYLLTANTDNLAGTGTISYQWVRGDSAGVAGTNIPGATFATYTMATTDVGKYIKVTVTRSGNTGSVTSSAVGPVQAAPSNTIAVEGAVTVSGGTGDVTVSITNTGSLSLPRNGTLTVTTSGTYQAYKWFVDNILLPEETGKALVLRGADYSVGAHRILVIAYRSGIPYSLEIPFTVAN